MAKNLWFIWKIIQKIISQFIYCVLKLQICILNLVIILVTSITNKINSFPINLIWNTFLIVRCLANFKYQVYNFRKVLRDEKIFFCMVM